jgi:hypothetical protein
MSTAFAFAYETLRATALKMNRTELLEEIENINGELSYIAEILHMYNEEDEIYQQNMTHGTFLLHKKELITMIYHERIQEFQEEIEDEYYEYMEQVQAECGF